MGENNPAGSTCKLVPRIGPKPSRKFAADARRSSPELPGCRNAVLLAFRKIICHACRSWPARIGSPTGRPRFQTTLLESFLTNRSAPATFCCASSSHAPSLVGVSRARFRSGAPKRSSTRIRAWMLVRYIESARERCPPNLVPSSVTSHRSPSRGPNSILRLHCP